ncbi:melanoma-associated antigen 10-like [Muntiacus reevesi]|uniref:melanoma-associated antigen 10-like n=1 Tax=Muntiacus reevesi TaxID=9886 RepID=UPI003306D76B
MVANLMKFLLFKYRAKEMASEVEMLKKVLRDNKEHFSVVFSQASECLQLVCGVEVKEVDPREHIYIMVPTLGLTCDAMLSSGKSMPKAGLLVLVLSLIVQNGDCTPKEEEGYLEYRQVSDNDPARFEFLWGPQACTETSESEVMEDLLRVNQWFSRAFPPPSAEAVKEEERSPDPDKQPS